MATKNVLCALIVGLAHLQTAASSAKEIRMPTARPFGRAATIGDHIYIFGGGVGPIDVFDTKVETWSRLDADCPASNMLYGDQIDGKLYLLDARSRELVRFDPQTKQSELLRKISTGRVNGTVIAFAGKLYAIGGYSKDVTEENCVAVYDPRADRWSNGPPLPGYQPLDHFHSAAVLKGKLHVVGGLLKGNKDQPHWRLDGDRWTKLADAPLHATWKHAALVSVARKLYLIAPHATLPNNQRSSSKDNFYCYHSETDRWDLVGQAPDEMPGTLFIPAAVGNKIYFFGGISDRRSSTSAHIYEVENRQWR